MKFAVMYVERDGILSINGNEVAVPLKWAEGMLGCVPVFGTEDEAKAYAVELANEIGYPIHVVALANPSDYPQRVPEVNLDGVGKEIIEKYEEDTDG